MYNIIILQRRNCITVNKIEYAQLKYLVSMPLKLASSEYVHVVGRRLIASKGDMWSIISKTEREKKEREKERKRRKERK